MLSIPNQTQDEPSRSILTITPSMQPSMNKNCTDYDKNPSFILPHSRVQELSETDLVVGLASVGTQDPYSRCQDCISPDPETIQTRSEQTRTHCDK